MNNKMGGFYWLIKEIGRLYDTRPAIMSLSAVELGSNFVNKIDRFFSANFIGRLTLA